MIKCVSERTSEPGEPPSHSFVMVPVPAHRVLEVYALLSRDDPGSESDRRAADAKSWDAKNIKRAMELLSKPAQELVSCLAETPGVAVPLTDLIGRVSFSDGHRDAASLTGLLGPIQRNVNWVRGSSPELIGMPDLIERTTTSDEEEAFRIEPSIARLVRSTAWKPRKR